MAEHTKGPWEWWTSNSLRRLSAGGKDGAVLCAVRCSDGMADIQVSEEDARLIAAAPDMLVALESIRSLVGYEWLLPEFDLARDAIAKATIAAKRGDGNG